MKSEQSTQNGSNSLGERKSISQEFQNSVFPQVKGLLTDAETVIRNEIRLLDARFFERVKRLETGLIFSLFGVGALFLAFGLFVFTIVYEISESFPSVPIWAVTGLMSAMICILGAVLITIGTAGSQTSKG